MVVATSVKALELSKDGPYEIRLQLPDIGEAFRNVLRTREVAEFLSGALAGGMTKAILAPLETDKNGGWSWIQAYCRQFCGDCGRAWMAWTLGWKYHQRASYNPYAAIELGTFECVTRAVKSAQEKWRTNGNPKVRIGNFSIDLYFQWISPVAVGGAAAGIVSTLACHPLEVIKDRLTVNRELYPSISLAINKIYRCEGLGGFYAGIAPTLVGMLPYSTCYYFMYETIKKSYCQAKKKKSLNRPELLVIGALSGLVASTISFPLEVARKRLMVGSLQGKCPTNMATALREVVRERGLLGLYRGWGASSLKVMPTSGLTWIFYEAWKDILLMEKPYL